MFWLEHLKALSNFAYSFTLGKPQKYEILIIQLKAKSGFLPNSGFLFDFWKHRRKFLRQKNLLIMEKAVFWSLILTLWTPTKWRYCSYEYGLFFLNQNASVIKLERKTGLIYFDRAFELNFPEHYREIDFKWLLTLSCYDILSQTKNLKLFGTGW